MMQRLLLAGAGAFVVAACAPATEEDAKYLVTSTIAGTLAGCWIAEEEPTHEKRIPRWTWKTHGAPTKSQGSMWSYPTSNGTIWMGDPQYISVTKIDKKFAPKQCQQ